MEVRLWHEGREWPHSSLSRTAGSTRVWFMSRENEGIREGEGLGGGEMRNSLFTVHVTFPEAR